MANSILDLEYYARLTLQFFPMLAVLWFSVGGADGSFRAAEGL
jgi:hypothetical protein